MKNQSTFPHEATASQAELQPSTPGFSARPARRPGGAVIVAVPILVVFVTFLFWYLTWFGRHLTEREMDQYLADTSVPHKTQHALSQLAEHMTRGDAAARRWYPLVLKLAASKESGLRLMSAWVMGQDNKSREFHEALRQLLDDPQPMVRWNAALALARFVDPAGDPQLQLMLRPYLVRAPLAGTISYQLREHDTVRDGSVVARIEPGAASAVEVRSPLAGRLEHRAAADGGNVAAGHEIAVLSPDEQQVWESLRALYLVGRTEDLEDVERCARGVPGLSENIRRQASLTAQAIRQRTKLRSEAPRTTDH